MSEIKPKQKHMSKEYLNALEEFTPKCESKNFVPPSILSEVELQYWNDLVKSIIEAPNHPVCDLDIWLMERYCKARADNNFYLKELRNNPDYYISIDTGMIDKNGQEKKLVKVNPYYKLLKESDKQLESYASELCLTHRSRVKYGITAAQNNKDKLSNFWEEILNRSDD